MGNKTSTHIRALEAGLGIGRARLWSRAGTSSGVSWVPAQNLTDLSLGWRWMYSHLTSSLFLSVVPQMRVRVQINLGHVFSLNLLKMYGIRIGFPGALDRSLKR